MLPPKQLCVFTAILDEDNHWIDQYLHEMERLALNFVIHFDRCWPVTKCRLSNHPLCLGSTSQNRNGVEFNEMHKQPVFDLVWKKGFKWAMALDIDETLEPKALPKLQEIVNLQAITVSCPIWQLWNSPEYIRIDNPFHCQHRQRFYNLSKTRFRFNNRIVNAPTPVAISSHHRHFKERIKAPKETLYLLNFLHHGMMTPELRLIHKERWDRIYSKAAGSNPYNFWNHLTDETLYPPMIELNPYI